ncbi:MAG: hypothetical protein R3F46_12765 [bacterium]
MLIGRRIVHSDKVGAIVANASSKRMGIQCSMWQEARGSITHCGTEHEFWQMENRQGIAIPARGDHASAQFSLCPAL